MRITSAGSEAPAHPVRRRPAQKTGFSDLVDAGSAAPDQAGAAESTAAAGAPLAVRAELPADPAVRDRQARQHGNALLQALSGVQASLLGAPKAGSRQKLAELASTCPQAADPDLDATLQAIAQRAAVELAKPV
jgi:hypothetical protein